MTENPIEGIDKVFEALGFRRITLAEALGAQQVFPSSVPPVEVEGSLASPAVHEFFGKLLDATAPGAPKGTELYVHLSLDEVGQLFLMCADHVMEHQLRGHPGESWIGCAYPVSVVYNVCEIVLDAIKTAYRS